MRTGPLREFHSYFLSESDRLLYRFLADLLISGKESGIYRGDIDRSTVGDVIQAVFNDVPESYRLPFSGAFEYFGVDGGMEFRPSYEMSDITEPILRDHVNRLVNNVKESCTTDYEKELMVHDWFADNVKYTFETYASEWTEFTVYGALVERKAVCMGISKAVSMILNRVGVDCGTYADMGTKHMWNIVRIDGKYYHLDVTWDMRDTSSLGYRSYDYFNVRDVDRMGEHAVGKLVPCTSTDANWYRVNGLVVRDSEDIIDIVKKALKDRRRHVVFKVIGMSQDALSMYVDSFLQKLGGWKTYRLGYVERTGRCEVVIDY